MHREVGHFLYSHGSVMILLGPSSYQQFFCTCGTKNDLFVHDAGSRIFRWSRNGHDCKFCAGFAHMQEAAHLHTDCTSIILA
jgi:hypothetical protein